MASVRIIFLTIVAACAYGIAHDQVTARVCVEYFTIGHPRVIESESPTALAFAWGVLATWWVGAIGGAVLAVAARAGRRPKLDAAGVTWPVVWVLVAMAVCSVIAGFVGSHLAASGGVRLVEPLESRVPRDRHVAFLADLWAHSAAYLVGFVGTLVAAVVVWIRRGKLSTVPA